MKGKYYTARVRPEVKRCLQQLTRTTMAGIYEQAVGQLYATGVSKTPVA